MDPKIKAALDDPNPLTPAARRQLAFQSGSQEPAQWKLLDGQFIEQGILYSPLTIDDWQTMARVGHLPDCGVNSWRGTKTPLFQY